MDKGAQQWEAPGCLQGSTADGTWKLSCRSLSPTIRGDAVEMLHGAPREQTHMSCREVRLWVPITRSHQLHKEFYISAIK